MAGAEAARAGAPTVRADASGWAVVALSGEQDAYTVAEVRQALQRAGELRPGRVVVDLTQVTFAASCLLGALAGALRRARRHAGTVRLVSADPRFTAKLRLTGLDAVLRVFPTLDQALNAPR